MLTEIFEKLNNFGIMGMPLFINQAEMSIIKICPLFYLYILNHQQGGFIFFCVSLSESGISAEVTRKEASTGGWFTTH
jgi:hypothetical protein